MNCEKIFDMIQGASDEFVVDAIVSREAAPYKKIRTRKMALIAAIVALMVMLMGCAVVMGLLDFKLGDRTATVERWNDDLAQSYSETVHQQVLTLSGLKGSDNFKAAKEWFMFLQSYDPDYAIRNQVWGNEPEFPAEYGFYNLYTQEMKDQLDAIAAKYDLQLAGQQVEAQSAKNMLAYLGLDGILLPDVKASASNLSAVYYENGYFQYTCSIHLEGENTWPYDPLVTYRYSPKACFDDTFIELNDTDDWEEWHFTTASGDELLVLCSRSDWRSWVFCTREDATISLRLETIWMEGTDENGVEEFQETPMTKEQMAKLLNTINFDLKPQPGDPELLKISTNVNSGSLSQTQNGYTLEIKSAVTDGRTARIIIGVTAPEGTVLCKKDGIYDMYGAEFGNFGSYTILQSSDGRSWRDYGGGMETMRGLEDGDGKENTVDILYITEMKLPNEGVSEIYFDPSLTWTLHIEGITMDRSEYPEKVLAQTVPLFSLDNTWNLQFTFAEDTDTQEMEFLSDPMTIQAKVTSSRSEYDVTMLSFRLSPLQLRIDWKDDMAGALWDYVSEPHKIVTVVMEDGTRIPLDGSGDYTIPDYVAPIDLDEVDYVELIDGTKIYPQA